MFEPYQNLNNRVETPLVPGPPPGPVPGQTEGGEICKLLTDRAYNFLVSASNQKLIRTIKKRVYARWEINNYDKADFYEYQYLDDTDPEVGPPVLSYFIQEKLQVAFRAFYGVWDYNVSPPTLKETKYTYYLLCSLDVTMTKNGQQNQFSGFGWEHAPDGEVVKAALGAYWPDDVPAEAPVTIVGARYSLWGVTYVSTDLIPV